MLIFTTNNRAICVSNFEQQHCETLLSHRRTHQTSPWGWMPPSQISPIIAQWRSVYDNDSFHYVTTGAESEQPVGAPCYQCVGCRDHAGITGFPHSGSWQAQGGPAYICRDQSVFYDMGPLTNDSNNLKKICDNLNLAHLINEPTRPNLKDPSKSTLIDSVQCSLFWVLTSLFSELSIVLLLLSPQLLMILYLMLIKRKTGLPSLCL